ncbi:alpha/beta hydrolase [Methanoculleus sp. FWC-SCC1]|uniref:Alpha/beta hydrolase n=1 Tax=Methanoculleus frigidifontis TaxID=2584085 RepID=A0ABT8ME34_9EURY|nr:alpha/beta hydrolase [Methanoculleus sp. FWC-SCC1]MDN7026205.1 alpha/beta hydrolase [Methanoculleus sp. FWC-SCC1]
MPQDTTGDAYGAGYKQWLQEEIARQDELAAMNRTAETAKGTMEYALLGDGPVVLGLHGMPGGYDQALFGYDWIAGAGFSLLAPSRPGYLGTPLSTGKTYPEMADAFAALLDTLDIDTVAVVTMSGGGPPGYEFAIRHPERISALVAIDSIVSRCRMPADFNAVSEALYFSSPGQSLFSFFSKHFPKKTMHELIRSNSLLTAEEIDEQVEAALQDPAQMGMLLRIIRLMSDYGRRKEGVENDIEQFTHLSDMPIETIRCPSLIVHGTHDNLLFCQAVHARDTIPDAESIWVPEGSHFCAWISPHAHDVQERIVGFLQAHCRE